MIRFKKAISQFLVAACTLTLVSTALLSAPAVRAAEAVTEPPVVHGLQGEYYTNSGAPKFDFQTLKATVLDPNLDFSSLEPALRMLTGQTDRVSVRWTGFLQPEYTEDYNFSIIGDNGFRLWVDNKLVIDHWVDDWDKEQFGAPISLKAGQKYPIKVEYFQNTGGSNIHLRWASPSVAKSAVPSQALYPPGDYVYNGSIAEDGASAEVKLDAPVKALPEGFKSHMKVKVMGNDWPITGVSLKAGDSSVMVLQFEYPVYTKDAWLVNAAYDGAGGLQRSDGTTVSKFEKPLSNRSKYQIMTPWASQLDKEQVLPEYPRPQMVRDAWMNLNGEWEFQSAKAGEAVPAGKTLKERILVPFAAESILSGIHRVENLMWYKRTFTVPDSWNGQRVKLNFGAVDYLATVYVNGKEVGSHKGGYTSFSFDITDQLKPGANELIVHVLDRTDEGEDQAVGKQTVKKLGGIWYTSVSGIWQTVWLEPVAAAHIEKLDMTPDLQNQTLKLTVPAASAAQGYTVEAVALKNGEPVGTASGPVGKEIAIPVPNPRLWSPDDPFLYDLQVRLKQGDRIVDRVDSYFGMREIKLGMVDGVMRPLLNGSFVFQIGPLDQGFYPDGIYTAPTEDALKFDIEAVKRLGMNMIRKHIKVEPARWYYWADKLGILVWQDMPSLEDRQNKRGSDISEAAKQQWLKEFKEMIDQLRSVPSIVEWTVFNEGWGQFDWGGQKTRDAVTYVQGLDSTRLINNASGWQDSGVGDLVDMHAYPAPGSPTPTSTRAAVLGEYGGLGLHVPGHEWSPLVFSYQEMKSKKELTDKYIQYIDRLKELKNSPGLSAAVYTQITDVEYEINGLLSYDRKVEKMDFDRIAKAHRELIGTTSSADLAAAIQTAEAFASRLVPGEKPGQYSLDAISSFRRVIAAAREVLADPASTSSQHDQAIRKLASETSSLFVKVHDPIPKGSAVDSFDGPALSPDWSIYREKKENWSLTANPGHLTLQTLPGDSYGTLNNIQNVFLKQAPEGDFVITTKVNAPVRKNFQQAGLYIWQDEDNYVRLGHAWDTDGSTGKTLETAYEKNAVYKKATGMAAHPGYDTSFLQIRKTGDVYTTYFWNGTAWQQAADPVTVQLKAAKVGFYAFSATDGTSMPAVFDYFSVGALQQEATAILTGPSTVSGGQSFELTLGLDSVAQDVYAQDLTLSYDPEQFEFVAADSLREGVLIVDKKVTSGKLRILTAHVGGAKPNGDLLRLQWKVRSSASAADSAIVLSDIILADGKGDETALEAVSHAIRITQTVDKSVLLARIADAQAKHDAAVEGPQAGQYPAGAKAALQRAIDAARAVALDAQATQPQVEQAASSLQAALQAFLSSVNTRTPGDTNGDGKVSIGDLAMVAAAYGKTSADPDWEKYKQADWNNDGKVDLEDLAIVAQQILQES
ncbi:PA14 domain-containing protein [Paenibacillus filicis]|uniref:PA14 domain-containing protein n=1 Tax=Paenibacillus filicis TaxID=669464 RepID=A0ABU9DGX8_9BACL